MNFLPSTQLNKGFTLIEILVVISIVGILMAVVGVNAVQSGQTSRDAKRQADLRMLQSAIELYKNKNGEYPVGCRGAGNWSGQQGTSYACPPGDTQYIVGLAPEFISVLPIDKKLNGLDSGYAYIHNAEGTVFKLIARNTVESEQVSYTHPFKSCDIRPDNIGRLQNLGNTGVDTSGWCTSATLVAREPSGSVGSYGPIAQCRMNTGLGAGDGGNGRFERTYGVWGGFAPMANTGLLHRAAEVRDTAAIICK
jgi:prepilin-type N-terminal cleavage/methylation domain-containing protein